MRPGKACESSKIGTADRRPRARQPARTGPDRSFCDEIRIITGYLPCFEASDGRFPLTWPPPRARHTPAGAGEGVPPPSGDRRERLTPASDELFQAFHVK